MIGYTVPVPLLSSVSQHYLYSQSQSPRIRLVMLTMIDQPSSWLMSGYSSDSVDH